ncbi:MAG: GEVED domain-containing protein, partial [Bacteroidota bacterium]
MKQNYKLSTRLQLLLVCLLAALSSGAQTIQLGSGPSTTGNTTASPVNGYYNFMHYQTVYTAAEINAQGVFGASNITTLAYNITAIPAGGLPNYEIRMANTASTNCAAHVADALTTVYSNVAPSFTPNSWNTFVLSTPFLWDGVSNLLVDVAFGSAPYTSPYGSMYVYSTTTGSRFVRCDAPCTSQANVVTTTTQDTKPQTRLNFVSNNACTGTPTAGIASAPVSACSAIDFNLVLSGYTQDLDITFQWQSSLNGLTYADISGGTTANILTSQTADTYYRQIVTCTNSGLSDTSNVVLVTMSPSNTCYCTSVALSPADSKIDSVKFLTISTGSFAATCDTFTDYTSLVATAQRTVPFNLRIRNGSCSGNAYTAYVAVYVDLNQNGILNDANELIYSYGPINTLNAIPDDSIIIPNSAMLGLTRMRIVIAEGGIVPPPCGYVDYDYGETEDYTLNITAAPGCINPPVAGSISGTSSTCSGSTVTLNLLGQDVGTDIQWQESADGSSWADITGADNTFYTTPAVLDTVYYRVKVTCADSSFTSAFTVTLSSFLSCYCTADLFGFCGDAEINNVTILGTTLNNNSSCNTTLNGDAYTAFPPIGSATATLEQTVPYTFNVNCSDLAIISVWIDYDQNGVFEADEWRQIAVSALNGTAQITIPLTAQLGQTGMRVRSRSENNPNGANDACSDFGSGETEDYIITIAPPPPCVTSPVGGTASGPTAGIAGTTVYTYIVAGSTGNIEWQYSTTSSTGPFIPVLNANDDSLSVTFNTSATYWIRAYVTNPGCDPDSSNTLQVLITYPGDDVCDAIALNFGINGPYNTQFASIQVGEPILPTGICAAQGTWCDSVVSNTLWFRFTAPASGRVKIQSPGFDTQLALWEADNCDSILTGGATLIGANDDDPSYQLHGGVNFSSHIDSAVCLTPGKTYFVQLDPYTSPGANTTIVLTDLGGVGVSLNFKTDVSCLGLGDGTIDMEVSGGSGSYTYLWSNGAITEDLSGLIAGSYTLTVTETGCPASVVSSAIVIDEPTAALVVTLDSVVDANCNGASTGGVYISITGGVAPYDVTWSNFEFTEDNVNVPAGSYSVFVSDLNACVVSFGPETVGEPAALAVTVDLITNSTCAGVSTGAIEISVSGGTSGYTFDWSNGGVTEDISNLLGGSYVVTVEDAEGCSVTQSATVGNNAGVSVTVDLVTNSACAGLSTGAVTISVSGGTPGYTFDWSNGAVTEDISGLAAGTYDVSVEDAVGCSATQSATVGNN